MKLSRVMRHVCLVAAWVATSCSPVTAKAISTVDSSTYSGFWKMRIGARSTIESYFSLRSGSSGGKLLWSVPDEDNDEWQVYVKQNEGSSTVVYDSGERTDIGDTGISELFDSVSDQYILEFECTNNNHPCEIDFEFRIIDCGCAGGREPIEECKFANLATATSAVCLEGLSNEVVRTNWEWSGDSGPGIEYTVSFGTELTDSSELTTEASITIAASVTASAKFLGSGTEATLSTEVSAGISKAISESLSVSSGTEITVRCPDEISPTGAWFPWQWALSQPADAFSRPGFGSITKNIICTDSSQKPPRCPLGFCADTQCQQCVGDFADLGTSDGDCDSQSCFSGRSTVEVLQAGHVPMSSLKVGDKIKVNHDGKFEPIYGFGHQEELALGHYLKIGWGRKSFLEITGDHMLMVASPGRSGYRMVPASTVQVGELLMLEGGPAPVQSVSKVKARGLYAPLTYSGTIVVNGVQASQYISVQNQEHPLIGSFHLGLNYHWLTHAFLLPVRIIAPLVADSHSSWVQSLMLGLIDFARQIMSLPFLLLGPIVVVILPLIVAMGFAEHLINYGIGSALGLLAMALITGKCRRQKVV